MLLQEMKTSTSDVMKSKIQSLLEEVERGIQARVLTLVLQCSTSPI